MNKIVKSFIFIVFFMFSVNILMAEEIESAQKIRAGAFAKVMAMEEFNTLSSDIGDPVKFLNTEDMFVYETNAIPKNTIFYGEIEDVREPVRGRDGALKVFLYKMETPDKKIYNLNAHLYNENDNYIGGATTSHIYYRKVPHYNTRLKPFLHAAPLTVLEMGRHYAVKPGEEFFVIFDKDIYLK